MRKSNMKPHADSAAWRAARRALPARLKLSDKRADAALSAFLIRLACWSRSEAASKEAMPRYRHD
jgi:hypothetical protein